MWRILGGRNGGQEDLFESKIGYNL
jgi:hypothetical protein